MKADWPIMSIADCASTEPYATQIGPFGKALTPEEYTESGVPLLRGVNVNHGRFHDDDFVYVSEETAERMAKYESFPGDVLLVHKGTLGKIGLMPSVRRHSRYIMGNSMLRVRCNPAKLIPEYLYYWLSSADGTDYIMSRVSQVGVPQIQQPLTTLRACRLPIPPLRQQKAIADCLGALDDKIELNRRMNQTLEAMARALFKSWFVDFEPVVAKSEGRPTGLPPDLDALFPSEFEDSPLGEIPRGWISEPLSTCLNFIGGGTPRTSESSYWGGTIPWFSVVDAPAESDVWVLTTKKHITEEGLANSSTRVLTPGTVIVTARGTVGQVALVGEPMAMNQSCYGLRTKEETTGLWLRFRVLDAVEELRRHSHGAVFDTITQATFDGIHHPKAPLLVMQAFEWEVASLLGRVRSNLVEIQTLCTLRDDLLPRLLSGEVEVCDPAELDDVTNNSRQSSKETLSL